MRFYKVILTTTIALSPLPLWAENVNDFFGKDTAKTVFENEITQNDSNRFQLLKPTQEKKVAPPVAAAPSNPEQNPQTTKPEDNSIIGKFGDPTVEAPVLAQSTAPKSFQGMMAALDSGDRKLAMQYAEQYVKYTQKLDQVTKDAVAIQALAMEKHAMLPENSWAKDQFQEERIELSDQLKKQTEDQIGSQKKNMANIDPKAKQFLEKAASVQGLEETEEESFQEVSEVKKPDEAEINIRNAIRTQVTGKVPTDPKGEIDVYFFINSNDQKSVDMGIEFEKFYALNRSNKKIRIAALTLKKEDEDSISVYRSKTNAKFPIANGSIFSKELDVSTSPTVVMVSKNTGQAVYEKGMRNFHYLDEVSKVIRGVK